MTASKFKLGDRVRSPVQGIGVVVEVDASTSLYPITVEWTEGSPYAGLLSCFTLEGHPCDSCLDSDKNIELLEEETEEEKVMANDEKFKVGDLVWSFHFGTGIVQRVAKDNMPYPVAVRWTDDARSPNTYDYFTKDGEFDYSGDEEKNITALEVIDLSNDGEVVDRMMDALDKKTDDAINPSHYKVKGLPEAHEIITHLMHREQLEGFYWGNIIKYAYRYGRKGDKAETAGKIAWYATQLKELEEEGEHNET